MLTARLIAGRYLSRTFRIEGGPAPYTVKYWPWGINSESILVDGVCAAKRRGWHNMTGGFRFRVGDYNASLIVALPWWCEYLPLIGLSYVRLEVDGQVLYEEGAPPKSAYAWTSPVSRFPVIEVNAESDPDEVPRVAGGHG